MKTAIVTGSNGQFGSYMCEYLIEKGYNVVGTVRRRSENSFYRIKHLFSIPTFEKQTVDILDSGALYRLIDKYKPDELYHCAAQSFVKLSWDEPYNTSLITGLGVTNVLEAVRNCSPSTRIWFAGSSEQFGRVLETPQNENTPFNPLSPYAAAKVYGFNMVKLYRESYGMFCCSSIMFNNESPRRGKQFVTRKITDAVAKIYLSGGGRVPLGNLDAKRDWSHTLDFVHGAWLMLQQNYPDDYVFASGKTHTIKYLLDVAFSQVGLDWEEHVIQDEKYMRPNDVMLLLGDASKAREKLGWKPTYTFESLISEMVAYDISTIRKKRRDNKNGLKSKM